MGGTEANEDGGLAMRGFGSHPGTAGMACRTRYLLAKDNDLQIFVTLDKAKDRQQIER
jgi:hypothetical protein